MAAPMAEGRSYVAGDGVQRLTVRRNESGLDLDATHGLDLDSDHGHGKHTRPASMRLFGKGNIYM